MLRAVLLAGLRWGQRWLHPLRRRRALRRLGRHPPAAVLFVCHGNICRSPYAAHALTRQLDGQGDAAPQVEIRSAGFIGAGRRAPPEAMAEAVARGVDLSRHRSQLVSAEMVKQAGAIFVMDGHQARELRRRFRTPAGRLFMLGDLGLAPGPRRSIHDPVDQRREVFSEVYDRIDRCIDTLATALIAAKRRSVPRRGP